MKKICPLLLAAVLLLAGCGKEAVHTGAQAQNGTVSDETAAENEAENETGAAENETENEADATDSVTENKAAQADSGTADEEGVEEMDEALRLELTEELLAEKGMDTSVTDSGLVTKGCSFTLPEAFMESEDVEGMYVTKRYPIDASAIHYMELEKDEALQLLTEESFKEHTEEQFEKAWGEDIEVNVDSFERMEINGFPAFRILCHYRVGDTEMTQLEYAINADKSYVITYSQTGEYDYMEEYEASAGTIRLKF